MRSPIFGVFVSMLLIVLLSCSEGKGTDSQESLRQDIRTLSNQVKSLQSQQQDEAKAQEAINKGFEKRLSEVEQDRRIGETPADKVKRAITDVRMLSTAVQSYSTDFNYYPECPQKHVAEKAGYKFSQIAELGRTLAPNYIKSLPAWDPWGNPYLYWTSPKKDHFIVLCTGAAGKLAFEELLTATIKSITDYGVNEPAITSPCIETNIIWYDNAFVQMPDGELKKCSDSH